MNDSISIIVPVYNVERYLEKCISSILEIKKIDFELLLINDGSTDSSGKICDFYAKEQSNIRVFHVSNGGVSKARNLGIKEASKNHITFVDADDWIDANAFENLFIKYIASDSDLMITSLYRFSNGKIIKESLQYGSSRLLSKSEKLDFFQYRIASSYNFMSSVYRSFYRKDLVSSIKFNESLKFHEDAVFFIEAAYKAKNVMIDNEGFYFYRYNQNSVSLNKSINSVEPRLFLRSFLEQFSQDNNIDLSFALACRQCKIYTKQMNQIASETKSWLLLWKRLKKIHDSIPDNEINIWKTDFFGKSFFLYVILMRLNLRRFAYLYLFLRFLLF